MSLVQKLHNLAYTWKQVSQIVCIQIHIHTMSSITDYNCIHHQGFSTPLFALIMCAKFHDKLKRDQQTFR